ncbi:MAG: hypothetical protein EOL88_06405 [Bacteroidia bacterium]|nr:hypothetical protein [Bacteroidia bacterium]
MIIHTRKQLQEILDILNDKDYPISLYIPSHSIVELEKIINHYKGNLNGIPLSDISAIKSRTIYLLNKFVEEVGISVRNTSMSYVAKKIQRSKEFNILLEKGFNATGADKIVDSKIKTEMEVFAERESMQEIMKLKYQTYCAFVQDLTQLISLHRKEIDMGIN